MLEMNRLGEQLFDRGDTSVDPLEMTSCFMQVTGGYFRSFHTEVVHIISLMYLGGVQRG